MGKPKRDLPIITILDGTNSSEVRCVPVAYVATALRGALVLALGGDNEAVQAEIQRLLEELGAGIYF